MTDLSIKKVDSTDSNVGMVTTCQFNARLSIAEHCESRLVMYTNKTVVDTETILTETTHNDTLFKNTTRASRERMSEQILNGSSVQIGYAVPFTSVHAGKLKIQKQSTTQKKQTTQNTAKQNYPSGLVAYYDTRPGNEVSLFYNAPKPTQGGELVVQMILARYSHLL